MLSGPLQQAGSAAHDAEDVAVLSHQLHFGLLWNLLLCETAQPVGDVVRQPGTGELTVSLEPPHGQPAHIQLDFFKGEQQAGHTIVLERGHSLRFKDTAVQQNACLGEQIVDAVHPLLGITAAALEDQALLALHAPQVVC